MEYRKILVVNLGGLGDFLLATPALRALKEAGASVSVLTVQRVSELAQELDYIEKVYPFSLDKLRISGFFANLRSLIMIRKEDFDLAINMRTVHSKVSAIKLRLLLFLINAKRTAGRNTLGRAGFFDIDIEETDEGLMHETEYNDVLIRALNIDIKDMSIDIPLIKPALLRIEDRLKGFSGKRIIGIHPGGMPSRRWPAANFSHVINELSKTAGRGFVITGNRNEAGICSHIARSVKAQVLDLSARLDVREMAALISRCSLFISNDTGPMHIAAALDVPLIALFGPGSLVRYDPRVISKKAVVFYEKKHCAPCERFNCPDMSCILSIKPIDVVRQAEKLLLKVGLPI